MLNIHESYRSEIATYLRGRDIRLHDGFAHLNSSQAFAFNLFYPYFAAGGSAARALNRALGIDEDVLGWEFESIPEPGEDSNIDVLWHLPNDVTVFCEVKLSEAEFGTATDDSRHVRKLEQTYAPRLHGQVADPLLERKTFFRHYQLLRNVYHMANNARDRLVLLLPKANAALTEQLDTVRNGLSEDLYDRVTVAYVEDVLRRLADDDSLPANLQNHARHLAEKYVTTDSD